MRKFDIQVVETRAIRYVVEADDIEGARAAYKANAGLLKEDEQINMSVSYAPTQTGWKDYSPVTPR